MPPALSGLYMLLFGSGIGAVLPTSPVAAQNAAELRGIGMVAALFLKELPLRTVPAHGHAAPSGDPHH